MHGVLKFVTGHKDTTDKNISESHRRRTAIH
jgi:hypothetical protein